MFRDILFRAVQKNDRIAYTVKNSDTADLNLATVLEVTSEHIKVRKDRGEVTSVYLTNPTFLITTIR